MHHQWVSMHSITPTSPAVAGGSDGTGVLRERSQPQRDSVEIPEDQRRRGAGSGCATSSASAGVVPLASLYPPSKQKSSAAPPN